MIEITCNLCAKKESAVLFRKNGFNLVQCPFCKLAYINPQPDESELTDFYQVHYKERDLRKRAGKIRDGTRRFGRIRKIAGGNGINILDVGCGVGYFLKACQEKGWKACGVEPSARAAQYGRTEFNLDIREGTLLSVDFPEKYFDVLTLYDVLEHVPDPAANLKKAFKLLRPSGFLVVETINFGHWKSKKQGADWEQIVPPEHLFYFTPATLKSLAEQSGFEYWGKFFQRPWKEGLKFIFRKPAGRPDGKIGASITG